MQPSFLEALGLFQWLGFALLVVTWPVYVNSSCQVALGHFW